MDLILTIVHIVVAAGLIGLVLLQQGKGADMGAAFGAGASSTVFGSQGSGSFLSRTTAVLATTFFVTSLVLAYMSGQRTAVSDDSVTDRVNAPAAIEAPAVPQEKADVPLVPEENATGDLPPQ
ncbi:MAG: preprotein translocase subunit SecG [Gammaproteobacteria bacterium]|nr:preprotein translocase subunit SecG [Gammaproteobacteria bacterium]MDH5730443.1 preprotein translocase subunit SecG [Gammaproteobacteria bacterium]